MDAVINADADLGLLIPGPALTRAYRRYTLIKIEDIIKKYGKGK